MNGKFEEKLAQLAFGDVSPEEAARIEAQVRQNPEAARLLTEFREMRGGLRDLAEVPEHQLSNERLREAILSQGLRPQVPVEPQRSRGLGAGWVWMPVAACALGFGLMMVKNQPKTEPMVVMKDVPVTSSGSGLELMGATSGGLGAEAPKATTVARASSKKVEASPAVAPVRKVWDDGEPVHRIARNRRERRFTPDSPTLPTPKWKNDAEDPANGLAMNSPKPPAQPETAASGSQDSGPIVLIDSNPDATTGAPTATEVGNTSNVVVGG